MWSKGAVVIVKHGDEEMANKMEKSLVPVQTERKSLDTCKTELAAKARQEELAQKIIDAEINYGYNWTPPHWAKVFVSGYALLVYGFTMFVDKYLRIKE